MKVFKVNAFTKTPNGGNPAGVVLDAPKLTPPHMKNVTKQLRVSETAFVYPSTIADYMVRFFSPELEVDLCGHATIATFFTMAQQHHLQTNDGVLSVDQETRAGILSVDLHFTDSKCTKVMMSQAKPILKGLHIEQKKIASALNIPLSALDTSFPLQKVSTGLFTFPVCVHSLDILSIMRPNFTRVKNLCTEIGVGSFHVFTFETYEQQSTYHARNFAPLYGLDEDPVTGTANGALSSYLLKNNIISQTQLRCEQGDIIGRPGRVYVNLDQNTVKVGGIAYIVEEKDIEVS